MAENTVDALYAERAELSRAANLRLPMNANDDGVGSSDVLCPLANDKLKDLLEPEAAIAREACAEWQPMPLNGADAELVADCCEIIGEAHAAANEWKLCAKAHRMACWYYRIALNERA